MCNQSYRLACNQTVAVTSKERDGKSVAESLCSHIESTIEFVSRIRDTEVNLGNRGPLIAAFLKL